MSLQNRPTQRRPADVLVEPSFRAVGAIVVPRVGVERFVAEEVEQVAAERVRALLDRRVDHGAGGLAELGRIGPRLHAEFLQRVDRGLNHLCAPLLQVRRERVIVRAVEHEVVPGGVVAVRVEERVLAAARQARRSDHDPRRQQRQLGVAPAEQRQVRDLTLVHGIPDVRGLRVQQPAPSGAHDDLFGQRAHGQREIDFNALLNVKLDVLADGAAEALKLRRDSVGSDLQARECVFPLAIGERIDRHTGRRLRRGDHRSRDHGAR